MVQRIEIDIERYPDVPLSPLDSVRLALQARGFRVGELSGRSFQVEWVEKPDGRAMRIRPRSAENRVDTVFRFNTDVYQALITTRSGSTGLSAHARADVPGWSPAPRVMFELQIPQNVAERIQFWGRINRRGQCAAPTVVTPSSAPVSYTHLDVYKRQLAALPGRLRQGGLAVPDRRVERRPDYRRRVAQRQRRLQHRAKRPTDSGGERAAADFLQRDLRQAPRQPGGVRQRPAGAVSQRRHRPAAAPCLLYTSRCV